MSITDPAIPILERTLGALVAERPERAVVLEHHGLDYCCNGHMTLDAAASAKHLDPVAVADELLEVSGPDGTEAESLDAVDLVDHILDTHHAYLHRELPSLVELAIKVRGVHGARHEELARVAELVTAIRDDLEPHLAKEERVLFPAIRSWAEGERSFPFGSMADPVRMMMLEHDRAGELLAALRAATSDYSPPSDGCTSYRLLYGRLAELEADTHRHVHLENNVLFPAVTAD